MVSMKNDGGCSLFSLKIPFDTVFGLPLRYAALIAAFTQLIIALSVLLILGPLLLIDASDLSKSLEDDLSEMANREGIKLSHEDMAEISVDAGNRLRNILKIHTGQETLAALIRLLYFMTLVLFIVKLTIFLMIYGLWTRRASLVLPWLYATLIMIVIIPTVTIVYIMVTRDRRNFYPCLYATPLFIHAILMFTWLLIYCYYVELKTARSCYNTYHKIQEYTRPPFAFLVSAILMFTWLLIYCYYVKLKTARSCYNTYHKTQEPPLMQSNSSNTTGLLTKIKVDPSLAGGAVTRIDVFDI